MDQFQLGGSTKLGPSPNVTRLTKNCPAGLAPILPHLPLALRGHSALNVPSLGILVCGGKGSEPDKKAGKRCFLKPVNSTKWEDFYELSTPRMNSVSMLVSGTEIQIIGGDRMDRNVPCSSSKDVLVLDLTNLGNGWTTKRILPSREDLCDEKSKVTISLPCVEL